MMTPIHPPRRVRSAGQEPRSLGRWTIALTLPLLLALPSRSHADEDLSTLLAALRTADRTSAPAVVRRIIDLGPSALKDLRDARDTFPPSARPPLERAIRWVLAQEIVPELAAGIESQLTYDGQYEALARHGDDGVESLLAIADDEALPAPIRVTALRALADVAKREHPKLLERLRTLERDVLLFPALREEAGIVLAVFGETFAVDREIRDRTKLASSLQAQLRLAANLDLARLYYRIRDYERAVLAYEQIVEIARQIHDAQRARLPAQYLRQIQAELAVHYYNAACSNSLKGDLDRTRELLREAVRLNPDHYGSLEADGDLRRLRADPGYEAFRRELGALFEKNEL